MEIASPAFKENARHALHDPQLQRALGHVQSGFVERRADAVARLPEFEALRESARAIKDHTLAHLDLYLEAFEEKVRENGGEVHYAETAADARDIILTLCRAAGARSVTKGKSMVGEEIALNEHLAANGITPVETDLGEYIIQLRDEPPSHIIAPAVHVTREQVEADFRRAHAFLPTDDRPDTDSRTRLDQCLARIADKLLDTLLLENLRNCFSNFHVPAPVLFRISGLSARALVCHPVA